MKTKFQLFAMIAVLAIMQACGSKTKENNASETTAATDTTSTMMDSKKEDAAAKRARIQKARAEMEQKRMSDYEAMGKTTPTYRDASGKVIYNVSEKKPMYTGGKEAMEQYLKDHLNYPAEARQNGVEGTVFTDFVVGADGKIRDVVATEVAGDDDQSLKDEAVRVVSSMPGWVAGTQNGKPVDTKYSIPITFAFSEY